METYLFDEVEFAPFENNKKEEPKKEDSKPENFNDENQLLLDLGV
jgi:hypothetical protein